MPKLSCSTFLRELGRILHLGPLREPHRPGIDDCRTIALRHLLSFREIAPAVSAIRPLIFLHGSALEPEALEYSSGIEVGLDLLRFIKTTTRINPLTRYVSMVGLANVPLDKIRECLVIRTESRCGTGLVIAAAFDRNQVNGCPLPEREEVYGRCNLPCELRLFD